MKEQWKKQMQQKMADYRESDIEVSWAEIEKALAKNRPQTKVVPLWMKRIAAAAAILLLVGSGYWYWTTKETITYDTPEVKTLQAKAVAKPETETKPASEEIGTPTMAMTKATETESMTPTTDIVETESTSPTTDPTETMTAQETTDLDMTTVPESEETWTHQEVTPRHQPADYPTHQRKSISRHNRLTAKIYLSNTMASSSVYNASSYLIEVPNPNPQDPDTGWVSGGDGGDGDDFDSGDSNPDGSEGESDNSPQKARKASDAEPTYKTIHTSESVQHHQPIRFGFSLRYRLDERWSLESGLTYTRLSADITNTVDGKATTTEQSLNYIGIPLSASYLIWGNRYFSFYLSAGGLVEKMVKGSRTTHNMTNSVSIHPLQVSVNGAAGAEFKFNDYLSLYAEPALNYYFDNGSSIPTLYQEKPLNFNLNAGIRFNIK